MFLFLCSYLLGKISSQKKIPIRFCSKFETVQGMLMKLSTNIDLYAENDLIMPVAGVFDWKAGNTPRF